MAFFIRSSEIREREGNVYYLVSRSGSTVVEQSTHHPKAKSWNLATTDIRREKKLSQQYMKESDLFSCSGSAVVEQSTHFPKANGSNLATTDIQSENT